MKRTALLLLGFVLFSAAAARADFVILRDGRSYSGTFRTAPDGKLRFKDASGIEYSFPTSQVQSLVFSNVSDHISLKTGESYTGQLEGATTIRFRGANGIGYVFPMRDVSSVVFTGTDAQSAPTGPATGTAGGEAGVPPVNVPPAAGTTPPPAGMSPPPGASGYAADGTNSLVVASGTQISVRTDEAINSSHDEVGKLYSARIQLDVVDSTGNVGIPAGTPAKLQVVNLNANDASGKPELALDLYSINLNGTEYRVDSSSVTQKGSAGYGANKRTAEYSGGGAAFGALMGAIFGGGKGAAIGALAGAGLGAAGQYATRGKLVKVPAESVLNFQVQQALVLHP
ncbi:MAG TPA: hypothetical protein VMU71_07190 [Terracidiphilus sp.]|nr:hypothetical protein [Terracidiphilus sp.]